MAVTDIVPGGPPTATMLMSTVKVRAGWRQKLPRLAPIAVLILIAAVGPSLLPYDPEKVVGSGSLPPGGEHIFGTDSAGLDVFSRTIAATGTNLMIALLVTVVATLVGIVLGLAIGMNESSGGVRGTLSRGTARIVDLAEAVPGVVIGLAAVAFYGANIVTLTLAMAFILCPIQIRLVRTEVLRVRSDAYLDAARMAGMSETELTVRHVFPNSSWAALENSSVVFAVTIILTAALGFIGVGLPPPTPEWGAMLSRGASDALVGRW
jgi:peptide/nickel transport system permease protein